ncbi:hypothetical protein L3Q82_001572 [Scortum barcoo]|uniref:Uncharacterized protein n=1 Tax=Scortum barcoo TaxID=214431 RepID=A0ACB8W8A6_9TELE|nr:hypothetical protein L3Q82_001572 [Scortum barcoo]
MSHEPQSEHGVTNQLGHLPEQEDSHIEDQPAEETVPSLVSSEHSRTSEQEYQQPRRQHRRPKVFTYDRLGSPVCYNMRTLPHHRHLKGTTHSGTAAAACRRKLKSNLQKKFQCVFEGIAKAGNPTLLNQIYTELYITEGGTAEVNDEHETKPTRTYSFTFPFTFRELNVLKEKKFSLVELVHQFFTETKEAGICRFEEFQVVFIFDGLDECRLPLDFHNNEILTDVTESTSVDVLLTNLIRGKLLPSARLWITTRPAAANQIPPECVDMVTEVRGFTDPQKEEYFRKRFRDEEQASRIISHIKTSRSLHIMCHIPVFCWITATVLEDVLKTREGGELPKTLTEMYIHFLVVQSKVKNMKNKV